MEKISTKKCYRCKETKSISEFIIGTDGCPRYCKKCHKEFCLEYMKTYERKPPSYEQNKTTYQKRKDYMKEWYFLYGIKNVRRRNSMVKMFKPGLLSVNISGICAICGEILVFGDYHHILGDKSDFTVMLCEECHGNTGAKVNQHCISIGNRIEWGALCWN